MWRKPVFSIAALAVVFTVMLSAQASGQQPDPVVDGLNKRMRTFFDQIKMSRIPEAYSELLKTGPLSTREDRKGLEDQTKLIEATYGPYRGDEPVYTKRIGSDVILAKYLYKCERYPVLWHVTFYQMTTGTDTSRTWQVVSIRFDTDLELLALLLRDQ